MLAYSGTSPDLYNMVHDVSFLSAGGNDYPFNIFREAGIDLSSDGTYEQAFGLLKRLIDEMELLVKRL